MMKDMVVTEIGPVPVGWEVAFLEDLGDFKNGINKAKSDFGHGFPFVNLMDVFGKYTVGSEQELGLINTNPAERNFYSLKEGDVLFVRSSVKPEGVGLTTLVVKDLKDTVYSGFLIRFRSNGRLDSSFKAYCFHSKEFRNRLISSSTVSANTNINQNALKKLPIPLPPLPEQRAIAAALSDVDALLRAQDRLIAKKEAVKQGVMQALLMGKERLPGFGGEWEEVQLKDLVRLSKNRIIPSQVEKELKVIELEHVNPESGSINGFTSSKEVVSQKATFRPGNVLFGKLRPYLKKFFFPTFSGACSTEIWVFEAIQKVVIPEYVYYLIQTKAFNDLTSISIGTKMPRADWKVVREWELSIPPTLAEQRAIATVLSDLDAELAALRARRAKYARLKEGMMQELLTGRTRMV